MEILIHKQAPVGLSTRVVTACPGLSSSSPSSSTVTRASSAAAERHGLLVAVGPTLLPLPVPNVLFVPRGRLSSACSIEKRKTIPRSSSVGDGDSLIRVYYRNYNAATIRHPTASGSSRRGRAYSTAENRDDFSRRRNATNVKVGVFGEREFEGVHRVANFRKCGECGECGECGRSRRTEAMSSSLTGNDTIEETSVDLEMEVLRFMQQSSKPDAFPSRQDLITAGRADLVMAIDEEGGWLAAGWEDGSNFVTDEGSTAARRGEADGSRRLRSNGKFKARSPKRSNSTARKSSSRASTVRIDEPGHEKTERLNGIHVVREIANAVDDKDGRWVVRSHRKLIRNRRLRLR